MLYTIILNDEQYDNLSKFRNTINKDSSLTTFVANYFHGILMHKVNPKTVKIDNYMHTARSFIVEAKFDTKEKLTWFMLHL